MNNKILIAGIVAVMLCATIVIAPADAEDTGFDVTDGEGRTFTTTPPPNASYRQVPRRR